VPAGLDELARGVTVRVLPEVSDLPIHFVPGVRTLPALGPEGWVEADVMRGEECETLGAWQALGDSPSPRAGDRCAAALFLWPGSHTKLVAVDGRGRIVRSTTTLAGELTQALARHTLLAASLPDELPTNPDAAALAAGARAAAREGLGRAAFLVRIAALTQALDLGQRASFLIGAVVADDLEHLVRHPLLHAGDPIWVGGRQPLRSLYAAGLAARHSGRVAELEARLAETASALGALAIARRHVELVGA
jgi:2-dehydro-3-deoxygalactonokinase